MNTQHLNPERISAYLAHTLSESDRESVEKHLTYCDHCRYEVIGAARFVNKLTPRPRYIRLVTVLAAAAAVLLVVVSIDRAAPAENANVLRAVSSSVPTFEALEPVDGSTINSNELVFVWHAEKDEPYYDLHLLDEIGNELWTQSTTDTSVILSPSVVLKAGQTYFWYVDALLRGVQTSTTGIRQFNVAP